MEHTELSSLKATQLRWMSRHYCSHRHSFLQHPKCYNPETYKEDKILFFDIETTAHEGFYWGKAWETNIIETINYGKILSYAAKWQGSKAFVRGWDDFKRNKEFQLVKEIWKLLDAADIVIAHNGKSFDIRWSNTKFAQYHLKPPSPYKVIDTKIESKKYLYLPSHSLNNIADYFDLGHKVEHEGFALWKRCIAGNKKAWKKMKRYNLNDTILLEKVFNCLDPFRKKRIMV